MLVHRTVWLSDRTLGRRIWGLEQTSSFWLPIVHFFFCITILSWFWAFIRGWNIFGDLSSFLQRALSFWLRFNRTSPLNVVLFHARNEVATCIQDCLCLCGTICLLMENLTFCYCLYFSILWAIAASAGEAIGLAITSKGATNVHKSKGVRKPLSMPKKGLKSFFMCEWLNEKSDSNGCGAEKVGWHQERAGQATFLLDCSTQKWPYLRSNEQKLMERLHIQDLASWFFLSIRNSGLKMAFRLVIVTFLRLPVTSFSKYAHKSLSIKSMYDSTSGIRSKAMVDFKNSISTQLNIDANFEVHRTWANNSSNLHSHLICSCSENVYVLIVRVQNTVDRFWIWPYKLVVVYCNRYPWSRKNIPLLFAFFMS